MTDSTNPSVATTQVDTEQVPSVATTIPIFNRAVKCGF